MVQNNWSYGNNYKIERRGLGSPYSFISGAIFLFLIFNLTLQAQINVDDRSDVKVKWFDEIYAGVSEMQSEFKAGLEKAEGVTFNTWELAGPYRSDDGIEFEEKYAPEFSKNAKWTKKEKVSDGEIFIFEEYEDPVIVYLRRNISAVRNLQLPLYFGTSNGFKIWLNGDLLIQNEDNEDLAVDQEEIQMNLKEGDNKLLIKLVCYENHPSLYFSSTPSAIINNKITDLLHSVFESLSNDMEKRKMYWEVEDGIWHVDLSENLNSQLAENYLLSINNEFSLYDEAQNLSLSLSSSGDLDLIRKVYALNKFYEQLNYINVNYKEDNERWSDYKKNFYSHVSKAEKLLTGYTDGENNIAETKAFLDELIGLSEVMPIRLPSTPLEPGEFGAHYTKLKYYPDWDKKWRVAEHTDVVVRFPDDTHKFVFWRGTNYIPHWVTEKGFWFDNEFNETWFSLGSAEPMSDKQCRYSHVRIIESNEARVIVHWRYALNDVNYEIAWPDKFTGWGDWSDEYYYIYPDAVSVRKVILHTSYGKENPTKSTDEAGHEWQEGIVVYHPFTKPEEYLNIDAVHVANMNGETGKWSWEIPGEPTTPTPEGSNIVLMNMKSDYKPFIISQEGNELAAYPGAQGGSHFRWRDHWPTTTEPTPGRNANGKQAAHGSFFHVLNIPYYDKAQDRLTKIMLHGLTEASVSGLVPVAKSWLYPPELTLNSSSNLKYLGYDISQRAYRFNSMGENENLELSFEIDASENTPLVNPVFIINNWGDEIPQIEMNGMELKKGADFTAGIEDDLESCKLVLWINKSMNDKCRLLIK